MLAVLAGCNGSEPARPAQAPQPAVNVPPPPPPPAPTTTTAANNAAPPAPAAPIAPPTETKKAGVGVGRKGRYSGLGVASVASLFAAKEKIAFEIQIPQAMNLFKASEGRPPKSHEEFMERIIKENQIRLPQLPDGDRYIYDPKTEQLMVEQWVPE
jgi:hypothetical protein